VLLIVAPIRGIEKVSHVPLKNVTHLGRLKSFSLFFVRPGTPGFENLVSQPVALTVPDMDAHDEESWTEPLPFGTSADGKECWSKYCGVKTKMVDTPWVFATQKEYEQYLRVVAECGGAGEEAAVSLKQYLASPPLVRVQ
jgi:hypothetical protein